MKKRNPSLIIGFSLPIAMIVIVAVSIYIPPLFIHPQYNFVYSADTNYSQVDTYSVGQTRHLEEGARVISGDMPAGKPQLYLHNITTNESTPISYEVASKLTLDASTQSPDGFTVQAGSNASGFFPFFDGGSYQSSQYLVGHNASKKLNVKTFSASYDNSIHFLGWIVQ
jgi:hypothetical protein